MSISEQVFKDNWEVIFGSKKCPVKNCHDGMVLHFDGDGGVLKEEECEVCGGAKQ